MRSQHEQAAAALHLGSGSLEGADHIDPPLVDVEEGPAAPTIG